MDDKTPLTVQAGLNSYDNYVAELTELRSYKRRVEAAWFMIKTVGDRLGDSMEARVLDLTLGDCPNCLAAGACSYCSRVLGLLEALEEVLISWPASP